MKRLIASLLSVVIVLCSTVAVCATDVYGDANANGEVEVTDATMIQRIVAKLDTLEEGALVRLDVNGDGDITVTDCTCVQQRIARIIDRFPVENKESEPTESLEPTEEITYATDSTFVPKETQPPVEGTDEPEPTEEQTQAPTVSKEDIYKALERDILRLVNVEREKEGLRPLKSWDDHYDCAKVRAYEINSVSRFSHTRPDGRPWNTVFDDCDLDDYYLLGENLALYFTTAEQVMYGASGWMNSPGHRANILHPDFEYVAIGVCESEEYEGYYAGVQLFFTPRG